MNPFVLARAELPLPGDANHALMAIDLMLRDGLLVGERRHWLFGWRKGGAFSMSLGLPILGGGRPVLRGRVLEGAHPARLGLSVGARIPIILFVTFWAVVTVVGGGYQVYLQARRVVAGAATWRAIVDVLPGIAIMAALSFGGLALWRYRARGEAHALVEQLRIGVGAQNGSQNGSDVASTVAPPAGAQPDAHSGAPRPIS